MRRKALEIGDAQAVLTYFQKKQVENPYFFNAVQCDGDGRATNFFWVDARSRTAYQCFGDVVTFDTTYKTNQYDIPFAPVTGVNHHYQSIQFGCALLQDETEETFLWLFQTWLDAMGGYHPICTITDQDLAMKAAIAKILPHTHHRLCLWHIMKKFGEKLSHIYFKKSNFKKDMKTCIDHTYRIEDFEKRWKEIIVEYDLESNKWLQDLFVIRESWVPVHNHGIFSAGMNTTGRSESINSFFDSFVTSRTNLRDFVVKYDHALASIVKRENDEDFESEHKNRIVNDGDILLKHASKVYTRNIFEKFKDEWKKVKDFRVETVNYDSGTYIVQHRERAFEKFLTLMCYRLTSSERGGCKGANKFRSADLDNFLINDGEQHAKALRLGHMCRTATQVACDAAESNEGYELFIKEIEEVSNQIYKLVVVTKSRVGVSTHELDTCNEENSQFVLSDPNVTITKGRKKVDKCKEKDSVGSGRYKSSLELSQRNKKRQCKSCKGFSHDTRNCPKNPKKNGNELIIPQPS